MNSTAIPLRLQAEVLRTRLPEALRDASLFVTWRAVAQGDRIRKVPHLRGGIVREGSQGTPEDRAGRMPFAEAVAQCARLRHSGIGLAPLPGDPVSVVAVDLDAKPGKGALDAEALARVSAETYTETSPSGHGRRALYLVDFPHGLPAGAKCAARQLEVFCASGFVTLTGHAVNDLPARALSRESADYFGAIFNKVKEPAATPSAPPAALDDWTRGQPLSDVQWAELRRDALANSAFLAALADRDLWQRVAHDLFPGGETGRELFFDLSRAGAGYTTDDAVAVLWDSIRASGSHPKSLWSRLKDYREPASAAPAPGSALPFLPIARVMAERHDVRWLLPDELGEGVIALDIGARGSFKSFYALHKAWRVALQGKPVALVYAEGADLEMRANAWRSHFAPDVDPEALQFIALQQPLNFAAPAGRAQLLAHLREHDFRAALLVIDTMSKNTPGLEESDNAAVTAFLFELEALRRSINPACTILLVGHVGHTAGQRARGAYSWEANTDELHIVERDPVAGTVSISRNRFKSSPELPPIILAPHTVALDRVDDNGVPVSSLVLIPAEPAALTGAPPGLGGNQATAWETLQNLLLVYEPDAIPEPVALEAVAAALSHKERPRDAAAEALAGLARATMKRPAAVHLGGGIVALTFGQGGAQ